MPGDDERERDDPHRLLRVVRPVREGDEAAGDELQPSEDAVHDPGVAPADDPQEREHDRRREGDPEERRERATGSSTLSTSPCHWTTSRPAAAIAEPTTPPMSAWLELDGRPRYQVIRFHVIAPTRPGEDDVERDRVRVDEAARDRRRDLEGDERAGEVEDGRHEDRQPRRERAGRDARRDRVRGVVEAVREVEEERDGDDCDEREVVHGR